MLRLPLGSKQDGLFLLSWWTRNVTGKNEHPEKCQEFPSSTDHMETYCKWNNRLKWNRSLRRAKANCVPQQPSIASAVDSKSWVSSWKRLLTPCLYSLQTHHSNWRRKSLFRCRSFAVILLCTGSLQTTLPHYSKEVWGLRCFWNSLTPITTKAVRPKLPKNVLQKYPPYINCLLKVPLT